VKSARGREGRGFKRGHEGRRAENAKEGRRAENAKEGTRARGHEGKFVARPWFRKQKNKQIFEKKMTIEVSLLYLTTY